MNRRGISIALGLVLAAFAGSLSGCAATSSDKQDHPNGKRDSGIVNGKETADYPAVGVLLQQGQFFCTGTVIGPRTVLTAGHCVDGQDASQMSFGLGSSENKIETELSVTAAVAHPKFSMKADIENDVAVLTLGEDAPVQPIELNPKMDQSWIGQTVTLVGFGVSDGPSQSGGGIKREVDVTIDQIDAQTLHYTDKNGQTACNGDSGGPAFASQGGTLLVAGITSWGDDKCQQFGVYTRVDAYLDFINEQLQNGGAGGGNNPNDPGNGGNPNDPGNCQDPNDPSCGGNPNDPGNGGNPNDPGSGGGCQGETWEGRCEGNTVIWCDDSEQVQSADCGKCGYVPEEGFYDCL